MTVADLVKPGSLDDKVSYQLDEREIETLKDAGVFSGPSRGSSRKQTPKHVVFVENDEQGSFYESVANCKRVVDAPHHTARQYASKQKHLARGDNQETQEKQEEVLDLGWNTSDNRRLKKKRKPKPVSKTRDEVEEDSSEASAVSLRRSIYLLALCLSILLNSSTDSG